MKLIKYDNLWEPWAELERFMNGRESLLGRYFGIDGESAWAQPPLNLYETDGARYVEVELPGVAREHIEVELENAVLTITAKRESGESEQKAVREYSRAVTVGEDIDAESITARLKDGILTVTLPRAEAHKPRQIEIK